MPLDKDDNKEPVSVRQSILGALETHAERGDDNARQTVEKLERREKDLAELNGKTLKDELTKKVKESNSETSAEDNSRSQAEAASEAVGETDKSPIEDKSKQQRPAFSGDKEAQKAFDALPSELKGKFKPYIEKLAKEKADTKAEMGRVKAERERSGMGEVDRVVDHYCANVEQMGSIIDHDTGAIVKPTAAHVVKYLFKLFDGLQSPDINERKRTMARIAHGFQIDVRALNQGGNQDWRPQRDSQGYSQHQPEIQQLVDQIAAENAQLQQQAIQQHRMKQEHDKQTEAAKTTTEPMLNNWSNGKTHFPKVKAEMGKVLHGWFLSGAIPENQKITAKHLQKAYEFACEAAGLDPSATKQIQQQQRTPNKQSIKPKNNSVRASLEAAFKEQAKTNG